MYVKEKPQVDHCLQTSWCVHILSVQSYTFTNILALLIYVLL